MGRITIDLLRRRSEHNDGVLRTVQELTLHQFELERIELLDRHCPMLQIVYLQNNLIPKIEHLARLKDLWYLNLALNNIQVVEGLEGCESLMRLDLTCNFVEDPTSIESLAGNYNLRELYLVGNPCSDYADWRPYAVGTLTQLTMLDGDDVTKSERIVAVQALAESRASVVAEWEARQAQREAGTLQGYTLTPEDRIRTYKEIEAIKTEKDAERAATDARAKDRPGYYPPDRNSDPDSIPVYKENGEVLQCNRGGYKFRLDDDDGASAEVTLDVKLSRFLDSSHIDIDLQPDYVRLVIKGKVLQLKLPAEIHPDDATAKRSELTGHLLITAPKVHAPPPRPSASSTGGGTATASTTSEDNGTGLKIYKLESDSLPRTTKVTRAAAITGDDLAGPVDIRTIVATSTADADGTDGDGDGGSSSQGSRRGFRRPPPKVVPDDFVDDPDVPPLE